MNNSPDAFFTKLQEVFPEKPEHQIRNVVEMVLESQENDNESINYENMINLLIGETEVIHINSDTDEEGAAGYTAEPNYIVELFPDICPKFLRNFLMQRKFEGVEEIINEFVTNGYTKRDDCSSSLTQYLQEMLPNANPEFLEEKARAMSSRKPEEVVRFIDDLVNSKDYPTMQEYLKNKQFEDELSMYTTNFDIDKYLEILPNPEEYYADPNWVNPLQSCDLDSKDDKYAITFLYNKYPYVRKKYIEKIYQILGKNLMLVCKRLDTYPKSIRIPRTQEIVENIKNLELIKQIAYLKHEKYIKNIINAKDKAYRTAKINALRLGLLQTCLCCGNDDLIPEECCTCRKGCVFCKECLLRGVTVAIGDGKLKFPCFNKCDSEFSLSILQLVLDKKTFEILATNVQNDELMRANVEGIDVCPFCGKIQFLPDSEMVFKCDAVECMKESCRKCKHESHLPLRCNEVEYDEDVQRRTFIENKMTEALIRNCWKCNKPFIKSTGCNKMTCECGALMCYLCKQPVKDYSHFGVQCPLFTNDAELDLRRVIQGAWDAKNQLGDVEIKFDPAKDLPPV